MARNERKVVTVVFADLVGFTARHYVQEAGALLSTAAAAREQPG